MSNSSRAKQAAAQRRAATREHARARERRKRKEAERRRALRRRSVLVSGLLVVLAGGCLAAVLVFIHNNPTQVTGQLQGVRDVSFVEGGQKHDGVSPVCGCIRPPLGKWRGVSFAARELTMVRSGRAPFTEWVLGGAEPNSISALAPPADWLTVTAVRFRTKGAFNPRWMLHGLRSHVRVLSEQRLVAYKFMLLNHGSLHAAMLGPTPVGAWVPLPGSHVKLQTQPDAFPQQPTKPTLTDTYPTTGTVHSAVHGQGYPFADLLLPDLVLWTAQPSAQMPETPFAKPPGPGVVTALLFRRRSTFSLQIAADPLSKHGLAVQLQTVKNYPDPREPRSVIGPYDHGHVQVTLDEPLSQAAYNVVKRRVGTARVFTMRVRADPFIDAPNGAPIPDPVGRKKPPLPYRYSMTERDPPLPLFAGWNVWGPLSSVTFSGVRGSASIGSRSFNLAGGPTLRLSGVKGMRSTDNQQLIEAPLATTQQSAKLAFRAVANVSINGNSETSWWVEHKTDLAVAALLAAILSAIAGVVAAARALAQVAVQTL